MVKAVLKEDDILEDVPYWFLSLEFKSMWNCIESLVFDLPSSLASVFHYSESFWGHVHGYSLQLHHQNELPMKAEQELDKFMSRPWN